ncbi:oxidoreductase [Xylophilus sp. Kf1]|nr:oxidoreductase [Xylophilus sp. Kf1]
MTPMILNDAKAARHLVERVSDSLLQNGIAGFRAPPSEPESCCGRGCNGCVWEGYFAAVGWWHEDAAALLAERTGA